jgi:DNA-binding NtrC family response regulator
MGTGDKGEATSLRLACVASPDPTFAQGRVVGLTQTFVMGREPGTDGLRLDDQAVSRQHIRFTWHEAKRIAELEDLASKNGTFVNALRTERRYMEPGDVLRIGETLFLVDCDPADQDWCDPLPAVVGGTRVMRELKAELARIAPGGLPVLLLGATGTGKEEAARALHELSARPGRFVAVNCSAIPENLFESTFFGHRRGAFTGASEDSPGLLRQADRGTLLLDEIGELPLPAQAKLLRFLEDGLVRAVGETRELKVSARIVAATNADLGAMEQAGRFRSDLLARLEGFRIELPALHERKSDILPLLAHFLDHRPHAVAVDALEALLAWPWPRNVRELKTVAARWLQSRPAAAGEPLETTLADLPAEMRRAVKERHRAPAAASLEADDRPSRAALLAVLEELSWSIPRVAAHYGKHRKQIHRWMEKYNLAPPD